MNHLQRSLLLHRSLQKPVADNGIRLVQDRPLLHDTSLAGGLVARDLDWAPDVRRPVVGFRQNCGATDQGGVPGRSQPAIRFLTDSAVFTWRTCLWYGLREGMSLRIALTQDGGWLVVHNVMGRFLTQMHPGKNGAALLAPALQREVRQVIENSLGNATEPVKVRFQSDGNCHVNSPGSTCWRLRVGKPLRLTGAKGLTFLQANEHLRKGTVPLRQHPENDNVLLGDMRDFRKMGERYRPSDPHRLGKLVGPMLLDDVNDTVDDLPRDDAT